MNLDQTETSEGPRLTYSPAIDGLRAIAVAAVVAFHLDKPWAVGGFLGVEVFLVISGFLITALMLAEHERMTRIDLREFWIRRARRLLPALFVAIGAVVAYMAIWLPDELIDIRGDVIAALIYITNWFLSFSENSYFEALGRPSPLQHLWSLAVEEQWYLLWPLVFAGALKASGGKLKPLIGLFAFFSVASTVLMAVLYDPDVDPSRIYYGTDTRAAGLLMGSVLALTWSPWRLSKTLTARLRNSLDLAAGIGLAGLLFIFWKLDELSSFLYRGGFAVVGLLTCLIIAAVVHPGGTISARALAWPPFVWLGTRSYGLYLWHWPIIAFTRPRLDVDLTGWKLDLLRIGLSVIAAELSYRLVERPVRSGAIGRLKERLHRVEPNDRKPRWVAGIGAVVLTGSIVTLGISLANAEAPQPVSATTADVADLIAATTAAPVTPATESVPSTTVETSPPTTSNTPSPSADITTTMPPTTVATTTTLPRLPRRIDVTGDSVAIMMDINFPQDLRDTFTVENAAIEGCGVIESGSMLSEGRVRRNFASCADFATRWAQTTSDHDAEIVLVVLGAWEVCDLRTESGDIAFGTPEHDAIVSAGITKGVDALLGTGAKVALLEVPCYTPVDGGGLTALPERGENARTAHLTELLQAVAATSDNVHMVTSPPEFCTDPTIGADLNLRWDGVHYGPLGGAFIWGRLEQQLLSIPVDY